MKTDQVYLGIDIGAESGRVMAGLWDGRRIRLEELHRFANGPVAVAGTLRWDVLRLWSEIEHGLTLADRRFGKAVVSLGVDTWGVDFALLSKSGELLDQPYHYRDTRTRGALERAFGRVPREEIFAATGIQFMEINTLYQLVALRQNNPEILAATQTFLTIPDYFNWRLSGAQVCEFTNATTTQCVDPSRRSWASELLGRFDLSVNIFPEIVPPGSRLGGLCPDVAGKTGLASASVIAPATHDTGSAVAAVPTLHTGKTNWAYLSSGTWSCMGVELPRPLLTARALELNVTNEGGVNFTCRLLKNIAGLWLVQQCRRAFEARGRICDYAELTRFAADSPTFRSFVDPDEARFVNPPDMAVTIQEFCRETGQPVPGTEGEVVRCALESLALKYQVTLSRLEELVGNKLEVIHIVGGGSQNHLLNQFTADACNRPVLAGPVEATVLGNVLVQARASTEVIDLGELRAIVRDSFEMRPFEPDAKTADAWAAARERFSKLLVH